MKLARQTAWKIVNDDGSDLTPYETVKYEKLIQQLMDASVLGDNSPEGRKRHFLRMAMVVFDNYWVAPKEEHPDLGYTPQEKDNAIICQRCSGTVESHLTSEPCTKWGMIQKYGSSLTIR